MIEPIENRALFSQMTPGQGLRVDNRSINESMVEPIDKKALFSQVTPGDGQKGLNNRSINESMIEPIENRPLFSQVNSGEDNQNQHNRSLNESMVENIIGNEARFSNVTPLNRVDELNESMLEPIKGNAPEQEQNDSQMVTPEKRKPKVINESGSHKESEGLTPNEMPRFD